MTIREIDVKTVLSKSNLPVSDYAVNPYVGCLHACKYCYASFMKRFTNHPELDELYHQIYSKKDRSYWTSLDQRLREYTAREGMVYVRDDDSKRSAFGDLTVVANYFYHEEVKKSAKKL